jgi:hypothetical protein
VLLGVAAAVRRLAGAPLPPAERVDVDRVAEAARQALGDEGFVQAVARGEALLVEAVAVAEQP